MRSHIAICALLFATTCARPITEVIVVVQSDVASQIATLTASAEPIEDPGRVMSAAVPAGSEWPRTIGIRPDAAREFLVTAHAVLLDGSEIEQSVRVRGVSDKRVTVELNVGFDCLGVVCEAGQTCREGTCTSIPTIEDAPEFERRPPPVSEVDPCEELAGEVSGLDADSDSVCAVVGARVLCASANNVLRNALETDFETDSPGLSVRRTGCLHVFAVEVNRTPIEVAVGAAHVCVRYEDQTLECAGSDLLRGVNPVRSPFEFSPPVTAIDAAVADTCVAVAGGIVCWGETQTVDGRPRTLEDFPTDLVGVALTSDLVCARSRTGDVVCEGILDGEIAELSGAEQIGVGGRNLSAGVCALSSGNLTCRFSDGSPLGSEPSGVTAFAYGGIDERNVCWAAAGSVACETAPVSELPEGPFLAVGDRFVCSATDDDVHCSFYGTRTDTPLPPGRSMF